MEVRKLNDEVVSLREKHFDVVGVAKSIAGQAVADKIGQQTVQRFKEVAEQVITEGDDNDDGILEGDQVSVLR